MLKMTRIAPQGCAAVSAISLSMNTRTPIWCRLVIVRQLPRRRTANAAISCRRRRGPVIMPRCQCAHIPGISIPVSGLPHNPPWRKITAPQNPCSMWPMTCFPMAVQSFDKHLFTKREGGEPVRLLKPLSDIKPRPALWPGRVRNCSPFMSRTK